MPVVQKLDRGLIANQLGKPPLVPEFGIQALGSKNDNDPCRYRDTCQFRGACCCLETIENNI